MGIVPSSLKLPSYYAIPRGAMPVKGGGSAMRNQNKSVITVKSKIVIQGRDTIMIPEGGVPVICADGNFGFRVPEAAAVAVNFLRCGCSKVQVVFDKDGADSSVDEMWTIICKLGDGENYHFGRLTEKWEPGVNERVDQIIEVQKIGA